MSPVLTRSATRFVGALTFSALAAEPARTSLFVEDVGAGAGTGVVQALAVLPPAAARSAIPHVELGRKADAVVVAPATARLIGCYAAGIASDLLSFRPARYPGPVLFCPAMHTEMWEHPAVQDNLALLRRRGSTCSSRPKGAWPGATSARAASGSPKRWWRRSRRSWSLSKLALVGVPAPPSQAAAVPLYAG